MEAADGVITSDDGRRVRYLARGPESGRSVLYLHGMPGCRREQLLFPDGVLERFGVRLISVDRPGWGGTDPIPGGDRVARSGDVLAVADALDLSTFALMATSSGGSYAVTLAAVAPERVDRVVLVSAQMPYDDERALADLQPSQRALLPGLRLGRIDAVIAACEEFRSALLTDPMGTMAADMATLSDLERAFIADPTVNSILTDDVVEAVRASVDGIVDDLVTWPRPFEVDLGAVRCPTLAIHATADDWEPLANLRRVLTSLDDARLVLLEGLNHFAPLAHPNSVMALLDA